MAPNNPAGDYDEEDGRGQYDEPLGPSPGQWEKRQAQYAAGPPPDPPNQSEQPADIDIPPQKAEMKRSAQHASKRFRSLLWIVPLTFGLSVVVGGTILLIQSFIRETTLKTWQKVVTLIFDGLLVAAVVGIVLLLVSVCQVANLDPTGAVAALTGCQSVNNWFKGGGGTGIAVTGGGAVGGTGDVTAAGYVPGASACTGGGTNLCALGPTSSCDPNTQAVCNAEPAFAQGISLYQQTGGKGITGVTNIDAFLKAASSVENRCRRSGLSTTGACGIVQFEPGTAAKYAARCNGGQPMSGNYCTWLNSHPTESICMAAYYFQDISNNPTCASPQIEIRNIAAGYNAGEGRCSAASQCRGIPGCDGSPVKEWELIPETRGYGPAVSACYYSVFGK